jgi:hypothetical protein
MNIKLEKTIVIWMKKLDLGCNGYNYTLYKNYKNLGGINVKQVVLVKQTRRNPLLYPLTTTT